MEPTHQALRAALTKTLLQILETGDTAERLHAAALLLSLLQTGV